MGSVRESSDAMAAPKAAAPVVEGVPVPAVAVPAEAVPGTPLLTAAPGTPMPATGPGTPMPATGPGTPGVAEAMGPSPSQQAATTPPASPKDETLDAAAEPETLVERKSKKQRLEETQETVAQLAGLVQNTLKGMKDLHDTLKINNEQQQELRAEIDGLAKQMSSDAITAKVVYTSLADFQRTLNNATWQLSGKKQDSNVSLKEVMIHLEDYARQSSMRLLETKNETRAQHASTITSIKEVTAAIKSLDTAIRLGTEQNQSLSSGAAPLGGGTVGHTGTGGMMSAPPPKAAPTATAAMGTPATPATSAVTTATAAAEATVMPGYGSAPAPAAMFPPPPMGGPVFQAAAPAPAQRAGRLRVALRDGSVSARAVSPHGRLPTGVTPEWSNEYGLGTVNCGGYVYRVLPDSYLEGSVALN